MIKFPAIFRNKTRQQVVTSEVVTHRIRAPLGVIKRDTVSIGNIAKEKFKSILGACAEGLENIYRCFEIRKAKNGFELFRFKSGQNTGLQVFDFYGKKQNLTNYLRNNSIEFKTYYKEHGNFNIIYFLKGNDNNKFCYIAEYSNKNDRLVKGYASLGDKSAVLKRTKSGTYEFSYTEFHPARNGNVNSEHTTLYFDKDMNIKESATEFDRFNSDLNKKGDNSFRLKFDDKGRPVQYTKQARE